MVGKTPIHIGWTRYGRPGPATLPVSCWLLPLAGCRMGWLVPALSPACSCHSTRQCLVCWCDVGWKGVVRLKAGIGVFPWRKAVCSCAVQLCKYCAVVPFPLQRSFTGIQHMDKGLRSEEDSFITVLHVTEVIHIN